jgi:hypothetical protein
MNKKKLLVNGPINTVRLEGTIDGIKKVLYLFSDVHVSVENQTKCPELRSIDFKKYLADTFDSITDKPVDFFFEIHPTSLVESKKYINPYKEKYIWDVTELFKSSFEFDPKVNKISKSTEFPNVRFHYIDVRAYILREANKLLQTTQNYISQMRITNQFNIPLLKDAVIIISSHVNNLHEHLYSKNKLKTTTEDVLPTVPTSVDALSKYTDDHFLKVSKQVLDKIMSTYKHDSVKKRLMSNLIDKDLNKLFGRYFKQAIDLIKYLESVSDKLNIEYNQLYYQEDTDTYNYGLSFTERISIITEIETKHSRLSDSFSKIFLTFMDIYFLRRFLDKDYVTNGVVYTGGMHTANYMHQLVKNFDFKITHYSYLKEDPKKAEKLIKESDSFSVADGLLSSPLLIQCSDLSSFPEKFQ